MNIKLSDEECSRWIAEKLEPKPVNTSVPEQPSPLGFWRSVYHHDTYRGSTDWQPRDMVNDPAMTVMLMEKLGSTGDIQIIGMGEHWQFRHLGPAPEMEEIIVDAYPLGRAVCEAFMLASGYKDQP